MSAGYTGGASATDDAARSTELRKRKMTELLAIAKELKIGLESFDSADSADNPKTAFIELILAKEAEMRPIGDVPNVDGKIFCMRNKWKGQDGKWISFRGSDKALRAVYEKPSAMWVKFTKVEGDSYLMSCCSHGNDLWISFANKDKALYSRYSSKGDAMPVKLCPTGEPNVVKMQNCHGDQSVHGKWISFTKGSNWLYSVYDEPNAMPIELLHMEKMEDAFSIKVCLLSGQEYEIDGLYGGDMIDVLFSKIAVAISAAIAGKTFLVSTADGRVLSQSSDILHEAGIKEGDVLTIKIGQSLLPGSYRGDLGVMKSETEWLGDEEAAAINNSCNTMHHTESWNVALVVHDGETFTLDIKTVGRPGLKYGPRFKNKEYTCKGKLVSTGQEINFSDVTDASAVVNEFLKSAALKVGDDNLVKLTYKNFYDSKKAEASLKKA